MRVWRCKDSCFIKVNLIKGSQFHAVLHFKAIIRLHLVKMTDNDEIFKPYISGAEVYSASDLEDLPTMDNLLREFPKVLSETVGKVDGCYRIKLDSTVKPVQHALRKVPVPLCEKLKKTLDELSQKKIIAKMVSPTLWLSSMLVVCKKNNSLRGCV